MSNRKKSRHEKDSVASPDFEVDAIPDTKAEPHRCVREPYSSKNTSRDARLRYLTEHQNTSFSYNNSDLHRRNRNCPKHPGHEHFIPIKEFGINHLPDRLKFPRLVELIRLKSECTVRLIILHTSQGRPSGLEVKIPPNGTRYGTGTAFLSKMKDTERCNCNEIKGEHLISGPFLVMTAGHVVYDDAEARNTCIEFFFDSEDGSGIVQARGNRVVDINVEGNRSIIECRTHDLNLYPRLKDNHERREKLIEGDLEGMVNGIQTVVVISHPHGASKHVTVGKLQDMTRGEDVRRTEDGMKLRDCILKYDAPTCPGSGGGSVHVIGGGTTVSAFAPHCSSKVGHGNISGLGWAREK